MYDDPTGRKWVDAHVLAKLLETLPEGQRVECNRVGNLLITDGAGDYAGYVDMGSEEIWRIGDGKEDQKQ